MLQIREKDWIVILSNHRWPVRDAKTGRMVEKPSRPPPRAKDAVQTGYSFVAIASNSPVIAAKAMLVVVFVFVVFVVVIGFLLTNDKRMRGGDGDG
ncbi:uncharacterized protein SPSK_06780 [Sporothrix schenckii 1099-18]|uniref:Uncharacterized protein n=1 Tax=Sporothrix schenckii 1099-18 TaxID=1397361 RepID=A0A0F2ML33_SPOSC|nr:uncharacterized protein SPSK_06780 [Sporothrix schenckii 1099-18]KJR89520.1 hypothetical protein SPSK_06780 [Sporothrix schenckii 1099-18]